jgi:hypothetical protein
VRILSAVSLRFPEEGSSAQGQSGPNARPKGVADGYPVNIPELPEERLYDWGDAGGYASRRLDVPVEAVGRSIRKIRWVANPEAPKRELSGSQSRGRHAAKKSL